MISAPAIVFIHSHEHVTTATQVYKELGTTFDINVTTETRINNIVAVGLAVVVQDSNTP